MEKLMQIIDESKLNRFHWLLAGLTMFIVISEGYDLAVYGVVLPIISEEFGLSTVTAGMIGSYGLIGMMVGSFFLGFLADKYGRKTVLIISLIIFSIFTAVSGFANTGDQLAILKFLAGIGVGGALPNAIALMTEFSPKQSRNTLVAIVLTGLQIGGVIAPLISLGMGDNIDWRMLMFIGGLPLLAVPILMIYLPETISFLASKERYNGINKIMKRISKDFVPQQVYKYADAQEDASAKGSKNKYLQVFENKRGFNTTLFWLTYFCSLLMVYGLSTWLPKLMIEAGYAMNSSLIFLLVLNGAAIIGTFLFGRLADKFGSRKVIIVLFFIAAASITLLGFEHNMIVMYILVGLAGACTAGTQNVVNAYTSQYYPAYVRSTALGLTNAVGRIGGATGPTFGGILLGMKLPTPMNFAAFAVPGVVAAIAFIAVREKKAKNENIAEKQSV